MKYTNFHKSYGRAKEKEGKHVYFSQEYAHPSMLLQVTVKNEKDETMTITFSKEETTRAYEQLLAYVATELKNATKKL